MRSFIEGTSGGPISSEMITFSAAESGELSRVSPSTQYGMISGTDIWILTRTEYSVSYYQNIPETA
jgi:hypothetical protein